MDAVLDGRRCQPHSNMYYFWYSVILHAEVIGHGKEEEEEEPEAQRPNKMCLAGFLIDGARVDGYGRAKRIRSLRRC